MKLRLLSILIFACVALTGASADTITWNFATTPNASLGTNTSTYTSDGVSITATGSNDLYYKVGTGANETGLGLACCDQDHEITAGQSIMFDLSSLFSKNVTSLALMLGSIQGGDMAKVCDVDLCITFNSSDNSKSVSILSLYYDMLAHHSGQLTVQGVNGDVLVEQLQATTSAVPEPSSFLFLGTGIFMLAAAGRFMLTQRTAQSV